ncbi:MAG: DUF5615 family PIN-like protein [Planctomycetota bacterium]
MRLLFDENVSRRLVEALARLYPGSMHVTACGLERADDAAVWEYARTNGSAIVTKDTEFHQRSFLYGAPPKVVWIRLGNCTTKRIESLLRARVADVEAFGEDETAALLVLP